MNLRLIHEQFDLSLLKEIANNDDNQNFKRLCLEYLPLKFSRRHGDPSRPAGHVSTLATRPTIWASILNDLTISIIESAFSGDTYSSIL